MPSVSFVRAWLGRGLSPDSAPAHRQRAQSPFVRLELEPLEERTLLAGDLDVDSNGRVEPLTDGLITLRYLFGFSGSALIQDALGEGAQRTDPNEISTFLDGSLGAFLDVDDNGGFEPLSDGLIVLRYCFGFTGAPLVQDALGEGAQRIDPTAIVAYLDSVNPGLHDLFPPGDGLLGSYFNNVDFTGASVSRVDPNVDFNWLADAPQPDFDSDTFSIRWTGQVIPPTTGTYTFSTISDDGIRLWVNEHLLIDNWTPHPDTEDSGSITLIGKQPVYIRLDYFEDTGSAIATLSWSGPELPTQIIAQDYLHSTPLTPPALPGAPANLAAEVSGANVTLTWVNTSGTATSFEVERSSAGVNFTLVATPDAATTIYQDAGLADGDYSYRVRAVNMTGPGAWSSVASVAVPSQSGATVHVTTSAELDLALRRATPGTTILMEPGVYAGDIWVPFVYGAEGAPIVVGAADPNNRPIIRGGGSALTLTEVGYLELRDLIIELATSNGLNINDGDTYDTPAHHVTLRNLLIRNIGSLDNEDGIKLSGLDDFLIENCTVENWGAGGQGIDMVGCHRGVIQNCTIRYNDAVNAFGLEAKGGSSDIIIRNNFFDHVGGRAIQLGGNTGLEFFRPLGVNYEAKDITVEHNLIVGAKAAVAFGTVDGSVVRFNTIYSPTTWVFRILQENWAAGMVSCRKGVITDNIVVWNSAQLSTQINIGDGTSPETFQFARNWWYCLDNSDLSTPDLPSLELNGTYGIDPLFVDPFTGDFHLQTGSPAQNVGAYAG